jgi:hypothetical protein
LVIDVLGTRVGVLRVDDGQAEFIPGDAQGDVIARFDDASDARRLLRGEFNPVVAGLQQRMVLRGNRPLGARIVLGLRTGAVVSPAPETDTKE